MIRFISAIFGVFVIYIISALIFIECVEAQGDNDVLWLARCMVNEADFNAVADHLGVAAVLQYRAQRRGVSVARMVRLYCGGLRIDPPRRGMVRLDCGDTRNVFYAVRGR